MDDYVAVDAKRILLRYGAPINVLDDVGEAERIELARMIAKTNLPERERHLRHVLAERGYMEPAPVKPRKSRAKVGAVVPETGGAATSPAVPAAPVAPRKQVSLTARAPKKAAPKPAVKPSPGPAAVAKAPPKPAAPAKAAPQPAKPAEPAKPAKVAQPTKAAKVAKPAKAAARKPSKTSARKPAKPVRPAAKTGKSGKKVASRKPAKAAKKRRK